MIKLYGSLTSPYVRHCRIVLMDTQTPFELVEADTALRDQVTPTLKVPYLEAGALQLHDSQSIVQYCREQAGEVAFPNIEDLDYFLLASTVLETGVNLLQLQRSGLTPDQVPYLKRQSDRVTTLLQALDRMTANRPWLWQDATIRAACMIHWMERRGFDDFSRWPALRDLHAQALAQPNFAATEPPEMV